MLNTLSKNYFLFSKGRPVFENDFFNLNYFVKKADTINLIFTGNKTLSFYQHKLLNLKDTLGIFLRTYDIYNGKEYEYAQNKDSVLHYIFYKNREAIFTTITDPIKGYNTFPTYIVFNDRIYYGEKNKYDYDIYLHKWS